MTICILICVSSAQLGAEAAHGAALRLTARLLRAQASGPRLTRFLWQSAAGRAQC